MDIPRVRAAILRLALFGLALLLREVQQGPSRVLLLVSGYLFIAGVLMFSGSLYGLALGEGMELGSGLSSRSTQLCAA